MRKTFGVVLVAVLACSPPVTVASRPVPGPEPTVVAAPAASTSAATTATSPLASRGPIPDRLSDADFWRLQADISEPGGYFQIENNFTSNENEVGELSTMLRDRHIEGGVYLGVGPEQNFSYIAAIRPKMAFIVDIRRQAAVQHLMFKAIFEMAKDRADFISMLFGKPRPSGLDDASTVQHLWELYRTVATDTALAARNYRLIVDRLTKTQGFTLSADESEKLKGVYDAFIYYGPSIATRGASNGRSGDFASLTGYAVDSHGQPQSFLSTEDNYRFVKSMHDRNLIVPITGDFGGPKALRTIGGYIKQHESVVRAFYVSNVEQYLFQDGKNMAFYNNVATLPVDSMSVFIRPYSMRRGMGGAVQSLCPIAPFIAAATAGRVFSNNSALECAK